MGEFRAEEEDSEHEDCGYKDYQNKQDDRDDIFNFHRRHRSIHAYSS